MQKHTAQSRRSFPLVPVLVIVISLPLIVFAARLSGDLRQRAAQSTQVAGIAWTMFDGDAQKSGTNASEPLINKTNVSTLKQLWQVVLPVSDGSPVYLAGASTAQGSKNLVYVTTKEGSLIAFDESTGTQV